MSCGLDFLQVQKWQKEPETPDVHGWLAKLHDSGKGEDLELSGQETS